MQALCRSKRNHAKISLAQLHIQVRSNTCTPAPVHASATLSGIRADSPPKTLIVLPISVGSTTHILLLPMLLFEVLTWAQTILARLTAKQSKCQAAGILVLEEVVHQLPALLASVDVGLDVAKGTDASLVE